LPSVQPYFSDISNLPESYPTAKQSPDISIISITPPHQLLIINSYYQQLVIYLSTILNIHPGSKDILNVESLTLHSRLTNGRYFLLMQQPPTINTTLINLLTTFNLHLRLTITSYLPTSFSRTFNDIQHGSGLHHPPQPSCHLLYLSVNSIITPTSDYIPPSGIPSFPTTPFQAGNPRPINSALYRISSPPSPFQVVRLLNG
jgi:hypothetical protein